MAVLRGGHDGRLRYACLKSVRCGLTNSSGLFARLKQVHRGATMLEQVLHDVLCRGAAAEQRVCLASTVAIDLAVSAARANACSVEASDGLIAIVDDLGVGIDANAARGVQHARGNAEGVERRGRDGPHFF